MVELKTRSEIAAIREAGRFIASVLSSVRDQAHIGMTLLDLDAVAHQMIDAAGARSVYLGYHPSFGAIPYPGVLCTSVNDAALHGLPSPYVLSDGDLLSIDFAAEVLNPRSGVWDRAARRGLVVGDAAQSWGD